jgi:hypothetical protein
VIESNQKVPKDEVLFIDRGRMVGRIVGLGNPNHESDACPRCGRVLKQGEWPWCKGNPADHDGKPAYGWRMG